MFKKAAMWFAWIASWFAVGFFGVKAFYAACDWFTDKLYSVE